MIQVNLDGFTKQQISMLLIRDDENKVNGDWVNSKSNYAKVIMLENGLTVKYLGGINVLLIMLGDCVWVLQKRTAINYPSI